MNKIIQSTLRITIALIIILIIAGISFFYKIIYQEGNYPSQNYEIYKLSHVDVNEQRNERLEETQTGAVSEIFQIYRFKYADQDDFGLFSGPQEIDIDYAPEEVKLPRINNNSYIFIEKNSNNSSFVTYKPEFILEGRIINTVGKIEVIWDGDMESYFLKEFQVGDQDFSYNISGKFGNIKEGENKYLIRGYAAGNVIYERIITITYIATKDKPEYLKLSEAEVEREWWDNPIEKIYSQTILNNGEIKYITQFMYQFLGEQRLKLNNGSELVVASTIVDGKPDFSTQMDQGGKFSNKIEGGAFIDNVIEYKNGDVLIAYSAGHEGVARYFLYDFEQNYIYDIYRDYLEFNDNDLAYSIYSIEDVSHEEIVIKEFRYCCDIVSNFRGHEIIRLDRKTKKIISRKNIEDIDFQEGEVTRVMTSSAWVIPSNSGYNLHIGNGGDQKSYIVVNPEYMNDYILTHTLTGMYEMSAKMEIYDEKYVKVIEILSLN